MSQYRNGFITSTGAAVNLNLGFVPDKFVVTNYTALATDATAVIESTFINNATPAGYASNVSKTITTGAVTQATVTTNGFTAVNAGGLWYNTNYTITAITKANPGIVTLSSLTPTGAQTLVVGDTVTISNVVGMTQVNQNRYIVGTISGNTFALYDLFGNPVNTTAFGTYSSGGIANMISYPATAATIDATTGQVTLPGQPVGNQYDIGYSGITLGTGVVGASTNLLFWEAWLETPTGY